MEQEMEYVYEVYRQRSFSKAAQKLFLSQPALSIAVRKVEKSVRTPLFDRSRQPLELTEAGKLYIEKVKAIRALEDEFTCQISDLSGLKSGKISIGGTQYFTSYVLPPVLVRFADRYPGVRMELTEAGSGKMTEKLLDGTIDLMFHCRKFDPDVLTGHGVFQDHLLLAVPADSSINLRLPGLGLTKEMVVQGAHLLPEYPCVPLAEFADESFLILTPGNNLNERALQLCRAAGFEPRVRLELEQLVTAYRLARHGLGVTFATALLVKESPDADMLYYKIDSPLATRSFHAILRKNGYISNAIRAFIDVLQEVYDSGGAAPGEEGGNRAAARN